MNKNIVLSAKVHNLHTKWIAIFQENLLEVIFIHNMSSEVTIYCQVGGHNMSEVSTPLSKTPRLLTFLVESNHTNAAQ